MTRVNPTVDPYDTSIGQQLKFFLRVNTSTEKNETVTISGRSEKMNMKAKLATIHSVFDKSEKPNDVSLSNEKMEKSIQIINGIPLLGTITSMLSSIAYLIVRALTEREFHKEVSRMFPGDKKKSQELFNLGKKYLFEIKNGNISDECLNEIAEVILEKKIPSLNFLTREDFAKISKTYLNISDKNRAFDFRKEMAQKFAHNFSDVTKQAMMTLWYTNMVARSMIGIIPFYKPYTRAVQYSKVIFSGPKF